jgi:hypothetical protein
VALVDRGVRPVARAQLPARLRGKLHDAERDREVSAGPELVDRGEGKIVADSHNPKPRTAVDAASQDAGERHARCTEQAAVPRGNREEHQQRSEYVNQNRDPSREKSELNQRREMTEHMNTHM